MPKDDKVVVGATVRFFNADGQVREEYTKQMPAVTGNSITINGEEQSLILPISDFSEIVVEYDLRTREEAEAMMFEELGLSEEEIADLKGEGVDEGSPADPTEADGSNSPIIRLDFGGSDPSDETPDPSTEDPRS